MFMDDDNFARPEEISTFIKVARHTNADVVTCCMEYFEGTDAPRLTGKPVTRWVPLGPDVAAGYFRNCYGDANCLVKRSTFEKLGGFTEIHGVTHEDWEFLANAALKGCHLEVIPESLFYYRYTPDSMIRSTNKYRNHMRHIRPYLNNVPPSMHRILLMAQGAWIAEANGRNRAWRTTELSLKWRSQYEAAIILVKLGHEKAGIEQFMTALKTATATEHPLVILEAMLDIGRELRKLDPTRARDLLRLAIDLGHKSKCSEAVNKAELLLAELNRSGKSVPTQVIKSQPTATQTTTAPVAKNPVTAPKVSIVIPTFNNLALTKACLDSLAETPCAITFETIVVDNASTDGSVEFLREQEQSGFIRLISNAQNYGFARACNQGAQAARASLVLFLNNDTQVTPNWLEAMVQAAERPKVGIVGAKLLYADNRIQHAGIGFIKGVPDHPHRFAAVDAPEVNQFRELDMVTGACLMINRDLCLRLAGFDEAYRNGVEDIDLCIRARAAGWKVVYEPKATVYHLEGQSAGRFNHVNENLTIFFARWGKSFDSRTNFIVPNPVKIVPASRSLLLEKAVPTKVDWIGSFLDDGS
jgi:GT2 family glycosyltransferase